ncbi:MAG TPA: cytidylate kinase family protein [Elusimicrobiota bacterium]|nr:cytidylate kinase family protein [Elusimicrobiota bacterium]
MRHELTLNEYFKQAAAPRAADNPRPPAPFLTISREEGAGGHELADALLARFAQEKDPLFTGWKVFDKEICERVAKDPGLKVPLEDLLNEQFHTGLDELLRTVVAQLSPQAKVDHHMFRTVRSICGVGKAIVIGRAGVMISRDMPLGVHVRLVASRKSRLARVRRDYGLPEAAAEKRLDQREEERERMMRTHFNKSLADPLLYDCVWNADTVTFESMADSLVALIRRRNARSALVAAAGAESRRI